MLIFKAELDDKTYQNDSVSMSIDDASISSCVFASDQVRDAKRFAKLILKIKETKNVGIFYCGEYTYENQVISYIEELK
jgi:hypothetical protein